MENEEWKKARLKIEEAIYILKNNYENNGTCAEAIIRVTINSLEDTLYHLNHLE